MKIINLRDTIASLRTKLPEYLSTQLDREIGIRSRFPCFLHGGEHHNMALSPKTNYETAHCFVCNQDANIFGAAKAFEGMDDKIGLYEVTIPELAKRFNVEVIYGEKTLMDLEKEKLYRLTGDIDSILEQHGVVSEYIQDRDLDQEFYKPYSMNSTSLISYLYEKGWNWEDVITSGLVKTKNITLFGEDRSTFPIKDTLGRTIAYQCRMHGDTKPKYLFSPESEIFDKSQVLVGLDTATKSGEDTIWIVEGLPDLISLKKRGILNSVALMGCHFSENYFNLLKTYKFRNINLCLDWDEAGKEGTKKILGSLTGEVSNFVLNVVTTDKSVKDMEEFIKKYDLDSLQITPAFKWFINHIDSNDPVEIIKQSIQLVALEPTAARRELMCKELSELTHISQFAIQQDVNYARNRKDRERAERLIALSKEFAHNVENTPDELLSLLSIYENRVENIDKEYSKNSIGPDYQLRRLETLLQKRNNEDQSSCSFKMNHFSIFNRILSGGADYTTGTLIYVGGRANSSKTAFTKNLAVDIALSDPDTMIINWDTDDSYEQIQPRIITAINHILNPKGPEIDLGVVVNPQFNLRNKPEIIGKRLKEANDVLKDLVSQDRFVFIDSEDGNDLSVLEKHIRYYRSHYPSKKLLVLCDNTHNITGFGNLERTERMTMISNTQKFLTIKYHACMIATAEYRKSGFKDQAKMILPVDDDLADARAFTYRPSMIMHVYNDLHDRGPHANIFKTDSEGNLSPRILLHITKNKISSFKDDLVLDMNIGSVTFDQVELKTALREMEQIAEARENNEFIIQENRGIYLDTDYEEEDDL